MNFFVEPSSRKDITGTQEMRHLPGHNTPPPVEMRPSEIKDLRRQYRHMMRITRPLRGYLGNQYNYWETKYNQLAPFLKKQTVAQ